MNTKMYLFLWHLCSVLLVLVNAENTTSSQTPSSSTTVSITTTTNFNLNDTTTKDLPTTPATLTNNTVTTTTSSTTNQQTNTTDSIPDVTTMLPTTTTTTTTTTLKTTPKHTPLKFLVRDQQDNQEVETFVGATYTFDCSVSGYPIPKMTWLKDDEAIHLRNYRMFEHDMTNVFKLTVNELLPADAGKYKCTADNGYSKPISTSVTLVVNDNYNVTKPSIEYFEPKITTTIYVGDSHTFRCNVKHVKDQKGPFIKWSRYSLYNLTQPTVAPPNSNINTTLPLTKTTTTTTTTQTTKLKQNEEDHSHSVIQRMSNITHIENGMVHQHIDLQLNQCEESYYQIESATIRDTGEYTCKVFNELGYAEATSYLIVKPVPPPTEEELANEYVEKYSKNIYLPYPLSVLAGLPVFLIVLLIVGCLYVRSREEAANDRVKEAERKAREHEARMNQTLQTAQKKKPEIIIPDILIQPDDKIHHHQVSNPTIFITQENGSNASLAGSYKSPNEDDVTSDTAALLVDDDESVGPSHTAVVVDYEQPGPSH